MKPITTLILFGLLTLILFNCSKKYPPETELTPSSPVLTISYQVPGDLPKASSETDLATFAWNEFFALNWSSSWATDNKRASPDVNWEFASQPTPDLAVWETYIHRTELRPANGIRSRNLDTGKPYYTFIDPIDTTTNQITLSDYWVNLDEDNEIGSCYVYAYDSLQVLYMAKTNLVEYNYVKTNFPTDLELQAATLRGNDTTYLKIITQGMSCNSDTASNVVILPCGSATQEGTIEIKLAWRFLDRKDDPTRFITKEVVYYTKESTTAVPVANKGQMALIGMHIIHKTTNYPAFIFASWEQRDVRNANMKTIGIDTPLVDSMPDINLDPHMLEPIVERSISQAVQAVNTQAWGLIQKENSNSLLQYYQLIGVQGTPLDYTNRAQDDNYFMANYVIESDSLLTFFHGSFGDPFNESIKNVVYNGRTLNMGGCQGCHGQAQAGGTNFSFLLDFGAGKPVPEPDPYLTVQMALDSVSSDQLDILRKKFK